MGSRKDARQPEPRPTNTRWPHLDMWNRFRIAIDVDFSDTMKSLRERGLPTSNGSTVKLVFQSLVRSAGNEDFCYPGIKKIKKHACCGRDAVFRAIKVLEAGKFVSHDNRQATPGGNPYHQTNLYWLDWDEILKLPGAVEDMPKQKGGSRETRPPQQEGVVAKRDQRSSRNATTGSRETRHKEDTPEETPSVRSKGKRGDARSDVPAKGLKGIDPAALHEALHLHGICEPDDQALIERFARSAQAPSGSECHLVLAALGFNDDLRAGAVQFIRPLRIVDVIRAICIKLAKGDSIDSLFAITRAYLAKTPPEGFRELSVQGDRTGFDRLLTQLKINRQTRASA